MSHQYPPNFAKVKSLDPGLAFTEKKKMLSHTVGFSSTQTIRFTPDLTYRMLDYWSREGIVIPSVQEANGSGVPRAYSFLDLVALRTLVLLRTSGMTLRALKNVSRFIQDLDPGEETLDDARLLITSSDVTLVRSDGHLVAATTATAGEPLYYMVDLGIIIRTLRVVIEEALESTAS